MNYTWKILKQFIAVDETDPEWAKRDIWVSILPDGKDTEDIYDTKKKAEDAKLKKEDDDKLKDKDGNDKVDKFGKKIKNRKYKIIEIISELPLDENKKSK